MNITYTYEAGGVRVWAESTQHVKVECGLFETMEAAKRLELDATLPGRLNGVWKPLHQFQINGWEGQRCRSCGAALLKGRCPVDRKDCGR